MLRCGHLEEHEAIIGNAVASIAEDLRTIDIEYLISFITLQMYNHVSDHVTSSVERYFTPGFITMGRGCEVDVGWRKSPEVSIDLIMHLDRAKVYFALLLGADHANIRLDYYSVDSDEKSQINKTQELQQAVKSHLLNQ